VLAINKEKNSAAPHHTSNKTLDHKLDNSHEILGDP